MITVLIECKDRHNTEELIKSLTNNAESAGNYQIQFTTDEPNWNDSKLIWPLDDDVIILGYQWDKRLLHFADKFPDGVLVGMVSMVDYSRATDDMVAQDYYPVLSRKWVELCGLTSVNRICRELSVEHGIDRRVSVRLVNAVERRREPKMTSADGVPEKARAVADYIKGFTRGS